MRFGGSTIASSIDGSTYLLGGVTHAEDAPPTVRWKEVPVSRGDGVVLINLGTDPGYIRIDFQLLLTETGSESWNTAISGKANGFYSLQYGNIVKSYCVLMGVQKGKGAAEFIPGEGLRDRYWVSMLFRKIRS